MRAISGTTEEIIDGDFDDISMLQDDIDRQMSAIVAEFGDEAVNSTKIKIYRNIPNIGKNEWLFDITPAELPVMERLRDEFGGGRYEARLYAKDADDKVPKLKKKFEILIGEPKRPPLMRQGDTGTDKLVTVMIEGFNKLGELIAATKNTPAAPPVDPITMQGALLQNMVTMKSLLGLDAPAKSDAGSLAQLKELVEVQKLIAETTGGGGDTDSNTVLMSLMNNVLPQLAEMGKQEQQANAQRREIIARKKGAKLPTQPAQPRPDEPAQEDNPAMILKPQIMFLTAMAAKNADPMTYANMVIDNTPADKLGDLIAFISAPNAIELIGGIHKPAANYPGWFRELGECVLELTQTTTGGAPPVTTTLEGQQPSGVVSTQFIAAESDVSGHNSAVDGADTENPNN